MNIYIMYEEEQVVLEIKDRISSRRTTLGADEEIIRNKYL